MAKNQETRVMVEKEEEPGSRTLLDTWKNDLVM